MFRLVVKNHEIGLENDTVQPGDSTFAHDEKIVLVIDEQVSRSLANQRLDVDVTGDKPKLKLMEEWEE